MNTFRWCFLIAATAASTASFAQPAYSSLYVFGDSLSDVGNDLQVTGGAIPAPAYYASGRFSNGANYADHLAAGLGLSPLLPSAIGGTDYAFGGARVGSVAAGLPATALNFTQQLAAFDAGHAQADPTGLYVLWIGANDMADALGTGNPAVVGAAIGATMQGIGAAVADLAGRGAAHFLIPNLPDLSLIPSARAIGIPSVLAGIHNASIGFNLQLSATLAQPAFAALDIRTLDVFGAQTAITANPGAYGFANVTDACYTGGVDGQPLQPGGSAPTACADPGSYLYWDYEHPTAALHELIGERALAAAVPEPSSWLMMALGLSGLLLRRRR